MFHSVNNLKHFKCTFRTISLLKTPGCQNLHDSIGSNNKHVNMAISSASHIHLPGSNSGDTCHCQLMYMEVLCPCAHNKLCILKLLLHYLLFHNSYHFTIYLYPSGILAHPSTFACAHMQMDTCTLTCVCNFRGTSASIATCASKKS
jgi:hypothetical protein